MERTELGRELYELGLRLGGLGTVLIGSGGGSLARALARTAGCGAALLATAHGGGPEDLRRRPVYRALLSAGVFRRMEVLERRGGQRTARVEALP